MDYTTCTESTLWTLICHFWHLKMSRCKVWWVLQAHWSSCSWTTFTFWVWLSWQGKWLVWKFVDETKGIYKQSLLGSGIQQQRPPQPVKAKGTVGFGRKDQSTEGVDCCKRGWKTFQGNPENDGYHPASPDGTKDKAATDYSNKNWLMDREKEESEATFFICMYPMNTVRLLPHQK